MKFNKLPFTHEQQLDQLIQRGLSCADRAEALDYLGHLNYYRLGAYWLPFEADHASHTFKPGTRFADVHNLYVFDRELRLLVLDAIERVEVSVRTSWAYILAHRYGPHAHLSANLFKKATRNWDYSQQSQKLETEARKSHETFLQHHYQKYDEPLPPVWAVVEIMTLGQLSKWYGNLCHGADRNAVAHRYDMDEINLTSFLHHLNAEVLPHVPDAWIDHSKTKVGYEIPLTRHFYAYQPPRPLNVTASEISELEKEIVAMLGEVV